MRGEDFKLATDFVYRTWLGFLALLASFVWRVTKRTCVATSVFEPVLYVLVIVIVGVCIYTVWTMAKASSSQEDYVSVGGGAVVLTMLLFSLWYAFFCGEV